MGDFRDLGIILGITLRQRQVTTLQAHCGEQKQHSERSKQSRAGFISDPMSSICKTDEQLLVLEQIAMVGARRALMTYLSQDRRA